MEDTKCTEHTEEHTEPVGGVPEDSSEDEDGAVYLMDGHVAIYDEKTKGFRIKDGLSPAMREADVKTLPESQQWGDTKEEACENLREAVVEKMIKQSDDLAAEISWEINHSH